MKLSTSTGHDVEPATPDAVREAIAGLTEAHAFAILEKRPLDYIQTSRTADGNYVLEYQEGRLSRHYRATDNVSADTVRRCFEGYLRDTPDWRAGLRFEHMPRICEVSPVPVPQAFRVLNRVHVAWRAGKRRFHLRVRRAAGHTRRQETIARAVDRVRWPWSEDVALDAVRELLGSGDEGISALVHLLAHACGGYVAWVLGDHGAELVPYLLDVWRGPEHDFAFDAFTRLGEAGRDRLAEEALTGQTAAAKEATNAILEMESDASETGETRADRDPCPSGVIRLPDVISEYRYMRGLRCNRCSASLVRRRRESRHARHDVFDRWLLTCAVCRGTSRITFQVPRIQGYA